MKYRFLFVYILEGMIAITISGCLNSIRYNMPCRIPKQVTDLAIVGTWQARYDGYHNPDSPSSRITGVETLSINADGTYSQYFESEEYSYSSQEKRWFLILDEGDGPKIQLEDFVYFANGLEYLDGPLLLSHQMPDLLKYDEIHPDRRNRKAQLVVNYPNDGFVYLYPRSCLEKFVLLQMVSGPGDPDALAVHNPPFTKVRKP